MTHRHPSLLLLAAGLALGFAGSPHAHADSAHELEPPAAAAIKGRRTWVPDLDVPPPSAEKTAKPTKQEWATAPEAAEVRVTDPGCTAQRVREWYRIECSTAHVGLVSGTRTELDVGRSEAQGTAWLVFPARRGDRRVALFTGFHKYGLVADTLVSEQWLDGDPAPMITVLGVF
jgi:hypothetical protein